MKAIVFIAHGSKKNTSNKEFITMVNNIKEASSCNTLMVSSFLEIVEPSIEKSTKELIKHGVKTIYYYPFFLNSGRHVLNDIPTIIKQLQEQNPDIELKLLNHFGKSEYINQIILKDISTFL